MRPLLRRMLRDGDMIGNHSWSHPDLAYLSAGEIRRELLQTTWRIRRVSGFRPCLMRPPYGAYNSLVAHVASSIGLRTIIWSVDPQDWALPGSSAIVYRVLSGVTPGGIILMHDGGGNRSETIDALPAILTDLARRHYRVVSVEELLHARLIR
jgi:peptidoglycan/xylan/chitin deacetylase (PgdA/CDA1 family)